MSNSLNNKTFPLVSVFVPTYNHESFIVDCLESILSQNYPNIEIICGDDASMDNTPHILKEYKKKFPNLIVLSLNSVNLGITKNCNKILKLCRGKYIAHFAGDDIMLPNKIRNQVELMEREDDCVICYHKLEAFDSVSNKTLYYYNDFVNPYEGDCSLFLQYHIFTGPPSIMVRSAAIPDGGYNEEVSVVSDWLYMFEVATHGKIRYINDKLARYRRHNNSATYSKRYYSEMLTSLKIIRNKYPEQSKYADQAEGLIYFYQAMTFFKNKEMDNFFKYISKAYYFKQKLAFTLPLVIINCFRKGQLKNIIDIFLQVIYLPMNKIRLISLRWVSRINS